MNLPNGGSEGTIEDAVIILCDTVEIITWLMDVWIVIISILELTIVDSVLKGIVDSISVIIG